MQSLDDRINRSQSTIDEFVNVYCKLLRNHAKVAPAWDAFYLKRLYVHGDFEGIVFELPSAQTNSWDQDSNAHALMGMAFSGASA
jgi:hypothetical protein